MEKAMAPHSSTVAWKIPWMEEPMGLQSMGSLRVGQLSDFTFTFHFHALEKEMTTHSNVLACRIPGTGEPGGLPSVVSHRVGHDWSDLAAAAGYMPRSGIAGSYGGFISQFLTNFCTIFHSGCINLHFHQQCKSLPFSPHPLQHLLFEDFDDDHSDWCKVISYCSFDLHFTNNGDVDHLFMCLLAICVSSLEKWLFRSFSHFLTELFVFLVLSCMSCLYILEINRFQFFHLLLFSPILRVVISPFL